MIRNINDFADNGDFIYWEDTITGSDMVRLGFISAKTVNTLIEWVLEKGRSYRYFPQQEISREQWGFIYDAHIRRQHHENHLSNTG
jgi:hypothetical protein